MRDRVDAFGVAEPELQLLGAQPDRGQPPRRRERRPRRGAGGLDRPAVLLRLGSNILDEDCSTNPDGESRRHSSRSPGSTRRSSGVEVQAENDSDDNVSAAAAALLRLRQGLQAAAAQRPDVRVERGGARGADADAAEARPRSSRSPTGILVVRDEKGRPGQERQGAAGARPLVGHPGQPGAVGHRHQGPGAELRAAAAAATRSSRSTSRTRAATRSRRSPRRIAQRGVDNALPGTNAQNASQHFAIVLDNELVSAPFINYQENPDGIDGSTGAQISGGFTIQSAQDLAKILQIGALPIKLELISRSQVSASLGAQALDQGLIAGIAGFVDRRALPDRLLPDPRRDRDARAGHLRALLLRARSS